VSVGVLLALDGEVESDVVQLLDSPGSGVRVVRRCADVPEVLAAAAAGLGALAVLDAELPGVDRSVVARLRGAGVRTVLVAAAEQVERCTALGPDAVEPAGAGAAPLAEAVLALARQTPAPEEDVALGASTARGAGGLAGSAGAPSPPSGADAGAAVAHGQAGTGAAGYGGAAALGTTASVGAGPEDADLRDADLRDADPDDDAAGPTATDRGALAGPAAGDGGAREGSPGQLVVVWGPPGAPGRTTLAVTLAAELAALSGPAVLIDADTEAPSVTQVLGILDDSSAVAAVARQALNGRLDPSVLTRLCPVVDKNLHVMTGLTRADRWRELPPSALEVVWEVARAAAAWTVVDTGATLDGEHEGSFGPSRHQATASALAAADVVVVVGAGEPVGMRRLVMALGELTDAEVMAPGARRIVVVNRVRASAAGPSPAQSVHEALARFAGVGDAVVVPDDRPALDKAVLQGQTLTQIAPTSPARRAVEQLAHRLTGERPRRARRRGMALPARVR
jgi:MinD-like ATPase involved in chromosome partitioning or flagellar assembly